MNFTGIKARSLRRGGLALCVALAALSGCGGGNRKVDFVPARIVSFGDEASVINAAGSGYPVGSKFTVNGVNATTGVFDCKLYPNWVQYLANTFALSFQDCQVDGTTKTSVNLATVNGKVATVVAALGTYQTSGASGVARSDRDLLTVLVGQNDVLELYGALPATGTVPTVAQVNAAVTELERRALLLAEAINRVAQSGPPVIVSTIPSVGLTPFARDQDALEAGRSNILTRMSQAYNDKLTLSLINDGHLIGLVNAETEVQNMTSTTEDPNGYGIARAGVNPPVCVAPATADLPSCTTDGVVTTVTAYNAPVAQRNVTQYLWAGTYQLGPTAHARLGFIAESRAKNNPF